MSRLELLRYPDADALARAAASEWVGAVGRAHRHGQQMVVALSGGRIARDFFTAVVASARAHEVPFASVQFFWADERCVPPDHAESNFALAWRLLLAPLGVQEAAIHRIRGELDGTVAAANAEAELRRIASPDAEGRPVLDLVFLGMGEDGHVASLFPGESAEAIASPAVYRAVIGPKPPPVRVTLSYGALAAAREVWVLASGDGKEAALHASLAEQGQTPLAEVLRRRTSTRIFTDLRLSG